MTRITVEPADVGKRLDRFLCDHLSLSRTQAQKLLATGSVLVDDRVALESHKGRLLEPNQVVVVSDVEQLERVVPEPCMDLTVVASDDSAIIVQKPVGIPVHPLNPGETGTLLNGIAAMHPQIIGVGEGGLRSGVVHRLDLETSGLVAFALADNRWQKMRDAFAAGAARKTYHAIVHGRLEDGRDERMHLYVAQHHPARVRVADESNQSTRACRLHWQAIEHANDTTLLEIDLQTGFLHQIRVMLAAIGHPVTGDRIYGYDVKADRLMLHATCLSIDGLEASTGVPFHL